MVPSMSTDRPARHRSGDLVTIRSEEEILATLDPDGRLEGLPFMPEMLRHCGETVRVYRRAHKTCDSVWTTGLRRMERTVFLQGLRCDGSAHGGCQAACLFFWKEEWLRPVSAPDTPSTASIGLSAERTYGGARSRCTREDLDRATRAENSSGAERFSCQATEIARATVPLPSSDLRQYADDLRSGNVGVGTFARVVTARIAERLTAGARGRVRRDRAESAPPRAASPSPSGLSLQPGERVAVRTKQEIQATLDARNRNRGLLFNEEMALYCGGEFRVLGRVERIIHEPTGEMHDLRDCVILADVICRGDFHRFCPRAVYPYWREAWLRKLE
jgi:hypothetical protein